MTEPSLQEDIRQAFRQVYAHLVQKVESALAETPDPTVIGRLRDEIVGYQALLLEVCSIIIQLIHMIYSLLALTTI